MSTMSIGGLASGLDTTSIIASLMAIERLPRDQLALKQSQVQAQQAVLQAFQTQIKAVQQAAADLRSPTLFQQTQGVESSDPTKVSATTTTGAGVGGYQLEVTQLANSAQRTFSFTSPAADGAITVDGHATNVTAGMTAQEVATAINSDKDATVYAAATDDGTLVLSARATGDNGAGFIDVAPNASLTENVSRARQGRDAQYTLDGVAGSSKTNVVSDAIAGVTLSFRGVTTTSGPVTVSVSAPGADVDAIKRKIQAFVDVYNSTIDAIRARLTERTVPDTRTADDIRNGVPDQRTDAQKQAGMLASDQQLGSLLDQMRQFMYMPVAGLPAGMDSLADLGISTGDATATSTADSLAGRLVIDDAKLTDALTTNPLGVRDLLSGPNNAGGWARGFDTIMQAAVGTGGMFDTRIDSASAELRSLADDLADWDQRLSLRQQTLQAQFTALEVAISQSQSQSAWLSGQLAGLDANNG